MWVVKLKRIVFLRAVEVKLEFHREHRFTSSTSRSQNDENVVVVVVVVVVVNVIVVVVDDKPVEDKPAVADMTDLGLL